MSLLHVLTWLCDAVALVTAIALLKDTLFDRVLARNMVWTLHAALRHVLHKPDWPDISALRPALRFGVRIGLLTLIVASAGVCVVFPPATGWQGALLRCALALHLASQVPCPWIRWITIGDQRAKLNDPPGVERRASR